MGIFLVYSSDQFRLVYFHFDLIHRHVQVSTVVNVYNCSPFKYKYALEPNIVIYI